jgi:hypothetical protein
MADTQAQAPHYTKPPRFNHVAMSMRSDELGPEGRAEIVDFYGDVFGWVEHEQMTEDGKRLVLGVHTFDQFVFLIAEDEPMRSPRMDHFGLSVTTKDDFDAVLERARARAAADARVDLVDHSVDDYEVVKIHSFYVRHLLPLMVEVQWWEWPQAA